MVAGGLYRRRFGRIATSDRIEQNQPVSARSTGKWAHQGRWAVGHLFVVAGPSAVGKSRLIRRLTSDDLLRERLGAPKGALRLNPRAAERHGPATLSSLILHYDLLRLLNLGIPTYEDDSTLAILLDSAQLITVLTLRTSPDRLRAQLEQRRTARPDRLPNRQAYLRTLQTLYQDDGFVDSWYDRWLDFVARYGSVTVHHSFIAVHEGYAATPVSVTEPAAASFSRPLAARPI
jgi:hypothetical protein